ncbi:hypothetical protein [Phaeobacter gallaeciensis]|uniref:hypothetical protein n=1 Tax=Phaeobacter gallaeciensis TaxID=60890 RepID=UPI00237F08D0|nr:hypothetical protein [Phaeobacter gallaeciensis]MDE4140957.1 hypothetical protein [Phaeobacter gallaeciensis]MDE4149402.1 hypothetical protein [Phaeobacter gallaeciensis]MDE4153405.1 hypothetical protein [Phaeobacter gallaeciensis]MDE4228794.1 hypothetical protein [Phaeobacter gallaeciensis]MDE4257869.1 hypothetical protein [Phaeobacter gallaeciensis]
MAKKSQLPKRKKRTQKNRKKTTLKPSSPCISISPTQPSTKSKGLCNSEAPQNTHKEKLSISNAPKKLDNYDNDFEHSKRIHTQSCKDHQRRWIASIRNRVFKSTDIKDFKALLGWKSLRADFVPACDLKARNQFGHLVIGEMQRLYDMGLEHPDLDFQWITIVSDHFMLNERGGVAEIYACKKATQDVLRNYTTYNALGVVEIQPIINFPKEQKGKMFAVHTHVFCWGAKGDTAQLKKRSKRFKSSITKLPIHSQTAYHYEGSFGRLGRYMIKPPFEGKEVDFERLVQGKACLKSARRVEKYHDLRLLELNAKLPLEATVFAVRDGVVARTRVIKKLRKWRAGRQGEVVNLQGRVDQLFEDFLRDNKKLKNYKPLLVKYKKGQ